MTDLDQRLRDLGAWLDMAAPETSLAELVSATFDDRAAIDEPEAIDETLAVLPPSRRLSPRWSVLVAAAAIVVVLGGLAFVRRSPSDGRPGDLPGTPDTTSSSVWVAADGSTAPGGSSAGSAAVPRLAVPYVAIPGAADQPMVSNWRVDPALPDVVPRSSLADVQAWVSAQSYGPSSVSTIRFGVFRGYDTVGSTLESPSVPTLIVRPAWFVVTTDATPQCSGAPNTCSLGDGVWLGDILLDGVPDAHADAVGRYLTLFMSGPHNTVPVPDLRTIDDLAGTADCSATAGAQTLLPTVVGLDVPTAGRRLACLGLTVKVNEVTVARALPGVIMDQAPAPGSPVVPGSVVTLDVNSASAPQAAPDEQQVTPLRVIGTVTLADGTRHGVGISATSFCLTDADGVAAGCDGVPASVSPAAMSSGGYGTDSGGLLYGIADAGLTARVLSDGTEVAVIQSTEVVDGHTVFMATIPLLGTRIDVEVRKGDQVIKRFENVPH